ncbi:hypothetical protein N7492_002928 [Penicillium capsulatum]|uniref:Uncharacterized protein n=1 Tax=Penicillium capsulatum TaxID=69766 RepID=A0A9W9IKA0_9EURO|nr:hypothetical protein N7492_002928 [Penicillium capsulatum]KAJ6122478.1 hypothetical protein N7512_004943 [Penicillium capsulatum]
MSSPFGSPTASPTASPSKAVVPAQQTAVEQTVVSLDDAKRKVAALPVEERYDAQKDIADRLLRGHEIMDDLVHDWFMEVKATAYWKNEETEKAFNENWAVTASISDSVVKSRIYIQKQQAKVVEAWGQEDTNRLFSVMRTKNNVGEVQQSDLQSVISSPNLSPIGNDQLAQSRLQYDDTGFLVPSEGPVSFVLHSTEGFAPPVGSFIEEIASPAATPERFLQESPSRESSVDDDDDGDYDAPDDMDVDALPADDAADDVDEDDNTESNDCGCKISPALICRFASRAGTPVRSSEKDQLVVLRKIATSLRYEFTKDNTCYVHAKVLCSFLGMSIRSCRARNPKIFKIPKELTTEIPNWRVTPTVNLPLIHDYDNCDMSLDEICTRIFGKKDRSYQDRAFHYDAAGSIVIPSLYEWLMRDLPNGIPIPFFDALPKHRRPRSLMDLIQIEFDLYDWHCVPSRSKPRLGWCRLMTHSLAQQLIRQDPSYAYPGEQTGFRHIDLNVSEVLRTGKGKYAIQGSVSLLDEVTENCTEVLSGMHRHLDGWWSRIEEDKRASIGGRINRIYPWMWTKEDEEKTGIEWRQKICMATDVRITDPRIPHGSTGPCTAQRRTILPWYVAVADDDERLDHPDSDSWTEVSAAHRDMVLADRTPSGFTSGVYMRNNVTPFPAAVQLTGLGPISDALVGRSRWDVHSVIGDLNMLFGTDRVSATHLLKDWRQRAKQRFVDSFKMVISAEMAAFGEDSFFLRFSRGETLAIDPIFIPPDMQDPEIEGTPDPDGVR